MVIGQSRVATEHSLRRIVCSDLYKRESGASVGCRKGLGAIARGADILAKSGASPLDLVAGFCEVLNAFVGWNCGGDLAADCVGVLKLKWMIECCR